MIKLLSTLYYDDIYLLPVTTNNIHLGWLSWMNNTEITKYLSSDKKKYNEEDLKRYLENNESLAFLACYNMSDQVYFGNLRIYQLSPGILSFGRLIGDLKFKGLGYGTKMTKVALDLCFNRFNAEMILVGNREKNLASLSSKKKLGFMKAENHLIEELGYQKSDYDMDSLYQSFVALADQKGTVYDYDLEAMIYFNQISDKDEKYQLNMYDAAALHNL